MNARTVVGIVVVVIAAASAGLFVHYSRPQFFSGGKSPEGDSSQLIATNATGVAGSANAVDAALVAAKAEKRRKWLDRLAKIDPYEGMSDEERAWCEELESAQSDEDFSRVQAAAEKAFKSKNPTVRQNAVEALAWFGEKALPGLMPLMADKDEDVAKAAMDGWELGLTEIENSEDRLATAQFALTTLVDRNALRMIGAQFSAAAQEWIDATDDEENATKRRVSVIQTLVDVLEADTSNVRLDAAKEIYEDVTGHEWVSIDEAEKYLKAPDDYEPPEDRGEAEPL